MTRDPRALVAHIVHRFDIGGLENGVVNLVNRLPHERFRHAIVALTEVADFRTRIEREDVVFEGLGKGPGHAYHLYPRLHRLFRELRPAVVHTRNIAALEAAAPAWSARVPVRVHGEHGWDVSDPDGTNKRYRLIRRVYKPFVTHYVALSNDLTRYLREAIGVPPGRLTQIYNGVDARKFSPRMPPPSLPGNPFPRGTWLVGTVGRLQAIKDQVTLARAFALAMSWDRDARERMRLVIIGDGPLRDPIREVLASNGLEACAWLPGARADVAEVLSNLDCFVLPSLAEGVSNTILEAMATALPIVATRVGGNGELLEDDVSGRLVASASPEAIAHAVLDYFRHPETGRRHGEAARATIERRFSLDRMVGRYAALYGELIDRAIHQSGTKRRGIVA